MSNYTPTTDFSVKDGLTSGDPEKLILGADFDVEFDAIETAIATKEDTSDKGQANGYCGLDAGALVAASNLPAATETAIGALEIATNAEALALALDTKIITPAKLSHVITNTAFVYTSRTITAGTGLTGGGDLSANRTISLSHLGIQSLADPNADRIMFWDDSAGATEWLGLSGLTISGTTLSVDAATESAAGKVELATNAETLTGTDTSRAITPANFQYRINPCGVFYAGGTQTISGTADKLTLNTTDFNGLLRGTFDATTNYRYTANSDVRVLVIARIYFTAFDSTDEIELQIRRSGTTVGVSREKSDTNANGLERSLEVTKIISLTASQYIEVYAEAIVGSMTTASGLANTSIEILELN